MDERPLVYRERPILFSGPMVCAIREGRKTQTRRIIRDDWWRCLDPDDADDREQALVMCPYGGAGDRLWVRETWYDDNALRASEPRLSAPDAFVYYRADGEARDQFEDLDGFRWRPSIHMPRWASRITLEVTSVRVERLQDITEADVFAEGVKLPHAPCTPECTHGPDKVHALVNLLTPHKPALSRDCSTRDYAVAQFAVLWEAINGKRAPWSSNPWVWVIEFKRLAEARA